MDANAMNDEQYKQRLFDMMIASAKSWAESEARFSTDPITLRAYCIADDRIAAVTDAMKQVSRLPEWKQYLMYSFFQAYKELLHSISNSATDELDGFCIHARGGPAIDADLDVEFDSYLHEKGYF